MIKTVVLQNIFVEINTFIHHGYIKATKSGSEDIYKVTTDFYFSSIELSIHL